MPIKIKSIEYTTAGVNILGDEIEIVTLQDGSTREIKLRGYAAPMGINDFGGDHELAKQKIAEHVAKVTGEAAASPIADNAVLKAELDQERAEKEAAKAEVEVKKMERDAERAEKEAAKAEAEQLTKALTEERTKNQELRGVVDARG